jgi:hypothetical protein
MRLVARLFAVLALGAGLAFPAVAQDLTDAQRQGLADRIASFDAAMVASDMETVMGVVPPRVLEKIAATYGVTVEQLIEAAQEQINAAMAEVKIESFSMDLDAGEVAVAADGTVYVLIPTETVIDMGEANGKFRSTTKTLGLPEGDAWYLVRIDDAQQAAIFKEVYPAFADVEFPTGTMEQVSE